MSLSVIAVLGLLLVLIAVGIPIAFALAISGLIGLSIVAGPDAALQGLRFYPFAVTYSWILTVIPLFVLMGDLAFVGGIGDRAILAIEKWFNWLRSGTAVATIIGSAAFGATTGSSLATVVTLGRIAIPKMRSYGFDVKLAVGCVTAGGLLGILIPPSIPMVIYGSMTNTSIPKVMLGGYIPGIITMVAFAIVAYWLGKFRGMAPFTFKVSWRERLSATKNGLGLIVVMAGVFITLYSGVLTATEVGAIGVLLIIAASGRGLWRNRHQVLGAFSNTIRTTCMIFMLLIGARLFSMFISQSGMPAWLGDFVSDTGMSSTAVLVIMLFTYIPLGMFLDGISMYFLTLPLYFPIVQSLGIDPVWFGILMVKVVEIGLLTPPVALNVLAVHSIATDIPITTILKGIVPFLVGEIVVLSLLVAFPELTLWVPRLVYGG